MPDVTIVAIDDVARDLTREALESALRVVKPRDVTVWSGRTDTAPGGSTIYMSQLPSLMSVARALWYEVPGAIRTSHFLTVQWDGWPVNPDAWTDEYLEYDYIGAPWHWHERYRVGNGGFSLRSKRLASFVAQYMEIYPVGSPEDEMLCRAHRPRLEAEGFRWAPEELARRFSVEHGPMDVSNPPFGFHDVRNWQRLLTKEDVQRRLVLANDYVRSRPGFDEIWNWAQN